MRTLCNWEKIKIIEAEECPEHVHMLVETPPKVAVSSFMGYLKGKTSPCVSGRGLICSYNITKKLYKHRELEYDKMPLNCQGKGGPATKAFVSQNAYIINKIYKHRKFVYNKRLFLLHGKYRWKIPVGTTPRRKHWGKSPQKYRLPCKCRKQEDGRRLWALETNPIKGWTCRGLEKALMALPRLYARAISGPDDEE